MGPDLDTPQPDPVRRSRPLRNLIMVTYKSVAHPWSRWLLPDVGVGRYREGMDGVTTYEQL